MRVKYNVGDWINHTDGRPPFQVTLSNITTVNNNPKWYEPIELTEDILLKCGFERIGGSAHIKSPVFGNYEWIELDWDGDHFNVFYRQENTEGEIDTILQYIELVHIHELQNWWKVNTGEELNVQL